MPRKGKYPILARGLLKDDWGFSIALQLKDRSAEGMENCITLKSAGGRWYFFIPVSQWSPLVAEINKMLSSGGSENKKETKA